MPGTVRCPEGNLVADTLEGSPVEEGSRAEDNQAVDSPEDSPGAPAAGMPMEMERCGETAAPADLDSPSPGLDVGPEQFVARPVDWQNRL